MIVEIPDADAGLLRRTLWSAYLKTDLANADYCRLDDYFDAVSFREGL